jgi:hypothetical protein
MVEQVELQATGYADRILPIDAAIALAWGALMARCSCPVVMR